MLSKLQQIQRLAEFDQCTLDDLVHDVFSRRASEVNNYGVEGQVDFLTVEGGLTEDDILQLLAQED